MSTGLLEFFEYFSSGYADTPFYAVVLLPILIYWKRLPLVTRQLGWTMVASLYGNLSYDLIRFFGLGIGVLQLSPLTYGYIECGICTWMFITLTRGKYKRSLLAGGGLVLVGITISYYLTRDSATTFSYDALLLSLYVIILVVHYFYTLLANVESDVFQTTEFRIAALLLIMNATGFFIYLMSYHLVMTQHYTPAIWALRNLMVSIVHVFFLIVVISEIRKNRKQAEPLIGS